MPLLMTRAFARACVLAALFLPALAFAQSTTGTLVGHVYDQGGTAVRGVKITVVSPTQIGGPKTTTTDDEGAFRLPGLTPGREFTVTATAPKLKTVEQKNVRITPGATTEIDLIMEVETAEEQITVIERVAPVDTSTAAVGESFDADFLNQLPLTTRDYQGAMALAPGVNDVGGTGNPNVRGGSYFNNSYTVDGFQTTDPVTHTFGQNFSFDAMTDLQVQTAGLGPENSGTTGGLTNIVTKSGSNRFELDGTATYSDGNLQFFKDARDIGDRHQASISLNVGGPVQRDRLWYYASGELISASATLPRDPAFPDHPSARVLGFNGFGKLTWAVNPRHKLELKLTYSPGKFENLLQSYFVEPEAEAASYQETKFAGLSWQGVLSDDLILVTRAGAYEIFLEQKPQSCEWDPRCGEVSPELDLSTGILRRNYNEQERDSRRTVEISGNLEWFKSTKRFGSHALKGGFRFMSVHNPSAQTVPGDAIDYNAGTVPVARAEYCGNDPKNSNGECRRSWLYSDIVGRSTLTFLQNAWKPTRYLTITPGVAFHTGRSENDQGSVVTDIMAATPHLSTVWDPTRDGRTSLRASVSGLVDTGFLALASFTSRQLYSRRCNWDDDAKAYVRNCRASGGESSQTAGLPCGPDGIAADGTSCRTELRAPRVWEYTVGAQREVVTGVTVGADVIHRRFVHQWEDLETNAIWNQGGTDVRREGGWRNGRAEFVYDLETPDEARRRYTGVTVALRKREGLLRIISSYTWSRSEGTDNSSFASSFLDNPGQTPFYYGPLADDFRHDVRFQATYQARTWLSAGVTYQFLSGGPYNRYGFDDQTGGYSRLQTRRGYDSQGTLNPDDDIPLRLPDISLLNLQVRTSLQPWLGQKIDLFADVINLLSLRTTLSVVEQDTPGWGRGLGRVPPTTVRLGLRYRF
jgi:hypothetical protein